MAIWLLRHLVNFSSLDNFFIILKNLVNKLLKSIYITKQFKKVSLMQISAFRLQYSRFNPWLCRNLNIYETFFPAIATSAFHPSRVGK